MAGGRKGEGSVGSVRTRQQMFHAVQQVDLSVALLCLHPGLAYPHLPLAFSLFCPQEMYGEAVSEMLTVQYRMNSAIMTWSSDELYQVWGCERKKERKKGPRPSA